MGAGYVGLVTGLCLADMGNNVTCVDVSEQRVSSLNDGKCPIFEKGLDELLERNMRLGRFRASMDINEIVSSDATFICVGTPSRTDGSLDLEYIIAASENIGRAIAGDDNYHVIVVKSTVPPGTTDKVIIPAIERSSRKVSGKDFGVVVNPEFLREGNAVYDFQHPDRLVFGARDSKALEVVMSLYLMGDVPVIKVAPSAAEMIKLASNSFLAARISLINEIGNICKTLGIDVRDVAYGVGMDKRIGPDFLRAGCGFGGSCFPKDVKGLSALAREHHVEPVLLDGILEVNETQASRMVSLLEKRMDIRGKAIGVLGLAFKPDTDDIREAVSLRVVRELMSRGARVITHDYQAEEEFRKVYPQIEYCSTPDECVARSDAVMILTEWPGYSDYSMFGDKLVVDGRGIVRTPNYEGICW